MGKKLPVQGGGRGKTIKLFFSRILNLGLKNREMEIVGGFLLLYLVFFSKKKIFNLNGGGRGGGGDL